MLPVFLCLATALHTRIDSVGYQTVALADGDSVAFALGGNLVSFLVFDSMISNKTNLDLDYRRKGISIENDIEIQYRWQIETHLAVFTLEKTKCQDAVYLTGVHDITWQKETGPNTCVFPVATNYTFSLVTQPEGMVTRVTMSEEPDAPFYLFIPNATTARISLSRASSLEMKWNLCEAGSFTSSSAGSVTCSNPYEVPRPTTVRRDYIISTVIVIVVGVILSPILGHMNVLQRCRRAQDRSDSAYSQLRLELLPT